MNTHAGPIHESTTAPSEASTGAPDHPGTGLPTARLRTSTEEVWRQLVSDWLPGWLEVDAIPRIVGAPLRAADGTARGRVLGCHVGHRIRLLWEPTNVQLDLALAPVSGGSTLTVRVSAAERAEAAEQTDEAEGTEAQPAQESVDLWHRRLADLETTMARTTGPIRVVPDVLTTT